MRYPPVECWFMVNSLGNSILSCLDMVWFLKIGQLFPWYWAIFPLITQLPTHSGPPKGDALVCTTVYVKKLYVYGTYFLLTRLPSHSFLTHITDTSLSTFVHISEKIESSIPPQKSTFDSRMLSLTQSYWRFSWCSGTGATLENATALPDFFSTHVALNSENQASQKNADDHGATVATEPGCIELTKHGGLDDSRDTPPLGTIKARCSDPPIAQQPFPLKKHPFSPQVVNWANLRIRTHREGKQGHFWPCQLKSLCPSTSIEGKRQGM